jgi:hypothetical protein
MAFPRRFLLRPEPPGSICIANTAGHFSETFGHCLTAKDMLGVINHIQFDPAARGKAGHNILIVSQSLFEP